MAFFTKQPLLPIAGGVAPDIIFVPGGTAADAGTIVGGGGADILRFGSLVEGDLLVFGANITGVEKVDLGTGNAAAPKISKNALDVDASAAVNGLEISGNDGDNFIVATAFNDTLNVGKGADQLYGGDGSDTFVIASIASYNADSVIDGEAGTDFLLLKGAGLLVLGAATHVELINVATGIAGSVDASAIFNESGLRLAGSSAANTFIGTDLSDTITGGGGKDNLIGGGGDDVFIIAAPGDAPPLERIQGDDGDDEIRFTSAIGGGTLALANTEVERAVISDSLGNSAGTTPLNIDASEVGTDITLVGNDGANVLTGGVGADTLIGGGGNDTFVVRNGLYHAGEVITGGAGFDTLQLDNISGVVAVTSSVQVEQIVARPTARNVSIDASDLAGGVSIQGNNDRNEIIGGSGNDTIRGVTGTDTLWGGDGDDTFIYASRDEWNNDLIIGGAGVDTLFITGASTAEYELAAAQVERLEVGAQLAVTVFYDGANYGGGLQGFGVTFSALNNTTAPVAFHGSSFADTMLGGGGNDSLTGRAGNDSLVGAAGADTLRGDSGEDTLDGGADSDLYVYDEDDTIADSGGSGTDTVRFGLGGTPGHLPGIERMELFQSGGDQHLVLDAHAQESGLVFYTQFNISNRNYHEIVGTAHADRFEQAQGSASRYRYAGAEGNDTFAGAAGRSQIEGGDGFDQLWTNANLTVGVLWTGIEEIRIADLATGSTGTTGAFEVRAGAAANELTIYGNNGANRIIGTRFDDWIHGNFGRDTISGGTGNDTITGGGGNDSLLGGAGDDVFMSFVGSDRIAGNEGSDTLVTEGQSLDLTLIADSALRGVENIDIRGDATTTLTLAFGDVKANLGVGAQNKLHVFADEEDIVTLAGTWTNLGTVGGATTHTASVRGQSVFVVVEKPLAGPQTYDAVDGPDNFTGGGGNDTITFDFGEFDPDEDTIHGGGGFDTLVLNDVVVNMGEAGFTGIERVELNNEATLVANDEALEVVAVAGGNEAILGGNAGQSYTGNASGDHVTLGAAGQEVHTGAGNDEVELDNDHLAGSVLDLGDDPFDQVHITGTGSASLLDAESVSAGLRISYQSIASLTLDDGGHRVFANANHDATFASGDNSGGDDAFVFGSNNWTGRAFTIQDFLQGAGSDAIEINIASFAGEYYGETDSAGVDALLPDDGLRNGVLDTELGALIVDYDQSGTYSAFGDLTIFLPGVTDLTAGTDILFAF